MVSSVWDEVGLGCILVVRSDGCGGICSAWMEVVVQAEDDGWAVYGVPACEDCASETLSA